MTNVNWNAKLPSVLWTCAFRGHRNRKPFISSRFRGLGTDNTYDTGDVTSSAETFRFPVQYWLNTVYG